MEDALRTLSPVDGTLLVERPLASFDEASALLDRAQTAQRGWRATPIEERAARLEALVVAVEAERDRIAEELTLQMGRPIRYTPGEVRGFAERARAMIALGREALVDLRLPEKEGFRRFIERAPLGVVLVLSPWNYPWLTAVNAVVPALMAGNAVLLKHSDQTPLVAERMVEAGLRAGLPEGLFHYVHASHAVTARLVADARVGYVAFTGSVTGGHAVVRAAADRFVGLGLELGGKDAGYVAADADLEGSVESLVDGAFFNSGQSCCGIERVYVHRDLYDRFVEAFAAKTRAYVLGDPRAPETTLGPVVRPSNAATITAQIDEALARGARALLDPAAFPGTKLGPNYLAPQVLVDVDHAMTIMREETFGPVVGLMKVEDDEDALEHINASPYGLTAAIFTADLERAERLGRRAEVGTVFANRCDYLDPELAWVGVKDSGRGVSLSRLAYEALTRPRSFHLRTRP
jgi:acyl-CoA reductase-like NAD-dependent aldehyde dehydrogenase